MITRRTLFAAFVALALLMAQGHVLAHVYAHQFSAASGVRDSGAPQAEYCKTCDLAAQFVHALVGDCRAILPERGAHAVGASRALAFHPALVLAFSTRAPPTSLR